MRPSGFSSRVSGQRVMATTTASPSLPLLPPAVGVDRARQDDGPAHARVVGLEPRAPALAVQGAGHALDAALDDRDDLALGAARAPRPDPDPHLVAVERSAERIGRDEDVVAARSRAQTGHEAEAPGVHREQPLALGVAGPSALRRTLAVAEPEAGPRSRREHALEAQAVEQPLEAEVVDIRDPEPRGDLADVHGAFVRAEKIQDLGASRQARGHRADEVARTALSRASPPGLSRRRPDAPGRRRRRRPSAAQAAPGKVSAARVL